MPRSSHTDELQYDPKIKTAQSSRKETKLHNIHVPSSSSPELNLAINLIDSSSDSVTKQAMANE